MIIETRRTYVDGPYGQVHVRIAQPQGAASLKTPLVLFHPSPYSGDFFKDFMSEMARDRTVIAIDTPGYGASDPPPEPPSIADYARSAAASLVALGHHARAPVDLLGYHTGGLIAAELSILEPQLVRRLALPGFPYFTGEARESAYAHYVKAETPSADGSHLDEKWAFAAMGMNAGVSLARAQEHFADLMQSYPRGWWSYHGVFSYAAETRLPNVFQPILLISYDGFFREETIAAKDIFANVDHVHIDGVTRGLFDLAADRLADQTRVFLDRN